MSFSLKEGGERKQTTLVNECFKSFEILEVGNWFSYLHTFVQGQIQVSLEAMKRESPIDFSRSYIRLQGLHMIFP